MTKIDFLEVLLTIAVVILVSGIITSSARRGYISHQELVDRGYAIYCPEDGKFAFIGECKVVER